MPEEIRRNTYAEADRLRVQEEVARAVETNRRTLSYGRTSHTRNLSVAATFARTCSKKLSRSTPRARRRETDSTTRFTTPRPSCPPSSSAARLPTGATPSVTP